MNPGSDRRRTGNADGVKETTLTTICEPKGPMNASVGGVPVNAVLYIRRVGEGGNEGAVVQVSQEFDAQVYEMATRREPVLYRGPVVVGGERFEATAQVSIFKYQPGVAGSVITIKASGGPTRI